MFLKQSRRLFSPLVDWFLKKLRDELGQQGLVRPAFDQRRQQAGAMRGDEQSSRAPDVPQKSPPRPAAQLLRAIEENDVPGTDVR